VSPSCGVQPQSRVLRIYIAGHALAYALLIPTSLLAKSPRRLGGVMQEAIMNAASTILVPVDFSTHSRAAAERACLIAKACHAEICLLHAMYLLPVTVEYSISETVWADLRESEAAELEKLRHDFEGRGIPVTTRFEEIYPADAIRSVAREPGVELIVMGSHGRHGIDRMLLGSVAERSVQAAPVPVLVVRESESEAAQKIRSILFATDFSEDAERAERVVTKWARLLGAEVEIFHAIRETEVLFAPYAVAGSSDWEGELKEAACRRIESAQARFEEAGVSAKSKIAYGLASEEIIKRAETTGAQVIAMGSRGYSALQRFVLGSVAQRVLRHAPCSVLVAGAPPDTRLESKLHDQVQDHSR
jgi:nucleotide-binding universal stress UspA family protein